MFNLAFHFCCTQKSRRDLSWIILFKNNDANFKTQINLLFFLLLKLVFIRLRRLAHQQFPIVWIETEFVPGTQRISLTVNGETKQDATISQMIFSVEEIVAFVTQVMTLLPGDVIITGTPAGIGPLPEKSTVTVSIEGLGELTNKVSARPWVLREQ